MSAGLIVLMMAAALATARDDPAASPASSASPVPSVAPGRTSGGASPTDKVECRRLEETGTRLGAKRICMSHREWADAAHEGRKMTEDVQNRGMVRPGGTLSNQ